MSPDAAPVRPEIVQAVYELISEGLAATDVADRMMRILELGPTRAEWNAGNDLAFAALEARMDHNDRQAKALSLMIAGRTFKTPPEWEQLFDGLPPANVEQLSELYDAMPEGARAEFDRRFGRPQL